MSAKRFFSQNGWMLACLLCTYALFARAVSKKEETIQELKTRQSALEEQKRSACEQQEELKMQVASQEDPAWVEMTLMKGLGLVPEGQRKVYFEQK